MFPTNRHSFYYGRGFHHVPGTQVPDIGAHFTSTGLGENRCSTRGRLKKGPFGFQLGIKRSRVFLVVWQFPKPGTTMRKSVTPQKKNSKQTNGHTLQTGWTCTASCTACQNGAHQRGGKCCGMRRTVLVGPSVNPSANW